MSLILSFFVGAIVGMFLLLVFACIAVSSDRDNWTDGAEHAELEDEDWEDK